MTFDDSEDVINLNGDDPVPTDQISPVESVKPLSTFDDPPPEEAEKEQVSPITSDESEEEREVKSVIGPGEKYVVGESAVVQEESGKQESGVNTSVKAAPPPSGLTAGYTQAQLDEVKAFNAGLTKGMVLVMLGGKWTNKFLQLDKRNAPSILKLWTKPHILPQHGLNMATMDFQLQRNKMHVSHHGQMKSMRSIQSQKCQLTDLHLSQFPSQVQHNHLGWSSSL